MVKTGRAPKVRAVTPTGEVTRFPQPVPVEFLFNWDVPFHNPQDTIEQGWALAYTRTEGLVIWMFTEDSVMQAWLPAGHIRRR